MATVVSRADGRAKTTPAVLTRASLCAAVVVSRVLVTAAGTAGALSTRVLGWQRYDPTQITAHLGSVGNLLTATAVRWDSVHYLEIAEHGYRTATNTVFFPLYPLLIHALAWVVRSDVVAGMLISAAAFIVSLLLLHRLTVQELGPRTAGTTVLLLAFAPLSFFFTAVYTESLFLALSLATFYLARRDRFGLAGMAAAAAALTRVPGILLVVPLAMMYLQTHGLRRRIQLRQRLVSLAVVSSPAFALGGFLCYLHSRGYGWLAPVTNQQGSSRYGHSMVGPLVTIWRALDSGLAGLSTLGAGRQVEPGLASPFTIGAQNFIYLIVFGLAVALLIAAWRQLPKAYAVYAGLVLLLCIWSPVMIFPLRSIDRYSLIVFPLWMAAAAWLEGRRRTLPVVMSTSTALLIFYSVLAARWAFIA